MRRMTYFVMALAMVLGFTQCKKEQTSGNSNEEEGNKVTITLNVDRGSNNGSRLEVNPPDVSFEKGDVIYVASDGYCKGVLEHDGTKFSGSIYSPVEGHPLYFYFFGNKPVSHPDGTSIEEGGYGVCWVDISDQTDGLPVISFGPSIDASGAPLNYSSGMTSFSAVLYNKCALVKFNTSDIPTSTVVTINNMYNQVWLYFMEGSLYGGDGFMFKKINDYNTSGNVKLYAESNTERWAILLLNEGENGTVSSTATAMGYGSYNFTMAPITADMYNETGINIQMERSDIFTVSDDGNGNVKKIHFAPGNLQYNSGETYPWRFAEHQWDRIGSYDESTWVDYFAWSTWTGDNPDPKILFNSYSSDEEYQAYQAWLSSLNWDNNDFTQEALLADESQRGYDWYTLSKDEWEYLLNRKGVNDNPLYAQGTANGVNGVILFPDAWTETYYESTVEYTAEMESAGAVFLPKAGFYRDNVMDYVDEHCYYWSSDSSNGYGLNAYCAFLTGFYHSLVEWYTRATGCSVRLVRNAN